MTLEHFLVGITINLSCKNALYLNDHRISVSMQEYLGKTWILEPPATIIESIDVFITVLFMQKLNKLYV